MRFPSKIGPASSSFRDVVLGRNKVIELVREFNPRAHPYPYAAPAFDVFLRPTLATLASLGPLEVTFMGQPNQLLIIDSPPANYPQAAGFFKVLTRENKPYASY
ncbi:hypothetical protein JCM10296v2_001827 [Rhodotorula toruloides]